MQNKNIVDRLGSVVKTARKADRLTQKQLAERLGITYRYLISIESGQQKPSYELLFNIIRELKISADTVFYPEYERNHPAIEKLQILLNQCDDNDVNVVIATLQSLLENKESEGR